MAHSSSTVIEMVQSDSTGKSSGKVDETTQSNQTSTTQSKTSMAEKSLGSAANIVKLLPSCIVYAFQSLSPSFSNHGECYTSNKWLTAILIALCFLSCVFFSFTDSYKDSDGKTHFGLATFNGLYLFDDSDEDSGRNQSRKALIKSKRIRPMDFVHAITSSVAFLTIAFSNSNVYTCFFEHAGHNLKSFLTNLPLGASFLSSLIFLVFPTTRNGIGYTETTSATVSSTTTSAKTN